MLSNPLLLAGGGADYQIQRSLRLRASATAYLSRTFGTPTNNKKWTLSTWVKRGKLGVKMPIFYRHINATSFCTLEFTAGDALQFYDVQSLVDYGYVFTPLYRDPSAHLNVTFICDTDNATAADRFQLWVNGTRVTSKSTDYGDPPSGYIPVINAASSVHYVGYNQDAAAYADGYLSEVNFIDGQALTPSNFGQTDPTTGVWTAKKYTGTFGANGFYLPFTDTTSATTLCYDASGNSNHWTPTNIGGIGAGVTCDSMLDVPLAYGTTDRGNYCTLNPLDKASNTTIGSGNLLTDNTNAVASSTCKATIPFDAGGTIGYTWEVVVGSGNNASHATVGLCPLLQAPTSTYTATNAVCIAASGGTYKAGVLQGTYLAYTTLDVIKFWVSSGSVYYSVNGVPANSGNAVITGLSGDYVAADFRSSSTAVTCTWVYNFGQRPFAYTPPTGFKALHTGNLPAPTILKPNKHFDVVLQTGNATGRTVTGLQFQPDLVTSKNRAGSANRRWGYIDSVRGVNKTLASELTAAEVTSQTDLLTSFNSDGFTVGADAAWYGWNGFVEGYVHSCWKAGGAAVTNNAGSISAQVSANAAAGFSIVTYTGTGANATVGHGLGVAPKMVIVKSRSVAGSNWPVYHVATGNLGFNYLNLTNAVANNASYWNSTSPTSSVFSLGNDAANNQVSQTFVAYCFAEIAGYSKFGSYTGALTDGAFVYCGFRPRFVLMKNSTSVSDWSVFDSSRDTYNVAGNILYPNTSGAETTSPPRVDFTATGFKIRAASGSVPNESGTYIFMALAESPFQYSLAR